MAKVMDQLAGNKGFGTKQFEQLIEMGRSNVMVKIYNRRNAAYKRHMLKVIDQNRNTDAATLWDAVNKVEYYQDPINDADILAYLNEKA